MTSVFDGRVMEIAIEGGDALFLIPSGPAANLTLSVTESAGELSFSGNEVIGTHSGATFTADTLEVGTNQGGQFGGPEDKWAELPVSSPPTIEDGFVVRLLSFTLKSDSQ